MPITKTAKRALRSSKKKELENKTFTARMEVAIRKAKNKQTKETVKKAISLTDRAVKKNLIHKNKAARIKTRLSTLIKKPAKEEK